MIKKHAKSKQNFVALGIILFIICGCFALMFSMNSFATENEGSVQLQDEQEQVNQESAYNNIIFDDNKLIDVEVDDETEDSLLFAQDSEEEKIDTESKQTNDYTYHATGIAKDCYGNPISDATVEITEFSRGYLTHKGVTSSEGKFDVAITSEDESKTIWKFQIFKKGNSSSSSVLYVDNKDDKISGDKDYGTITCPFFTQVQLFIDGKTYTDMKDYGTWYVNDQPLGSEELNWSVPAALYYDKGSYEYSNNTIILSGLLKDEYGVDKHIYEFKVNPSYTFVKLEVETANISNFGDSQALSSSLLNVNAKIDHVKPTPGPTENVSVSGKITEKDSHVPVKAKVGFYTNQKQVAQAETDANGNYILNEIPKDTAGTFQVTTEDEALGNVLLSNKAFHETTKDFNFEVERHVLVPLDVSSNDKNHDYFKNTYYWKDGTPRAASQFESYHFNIWEGETYYVKDGILYFNLLDDHYGQPSYMDFQAYGKDKYVVDKWTINGKVVTEEENIASNEEKIDAKCSYVYKEDVPPTPEPPSKDVTPAASNAEGGTASSQTGDVVPYAILVLSIVALSSLGVFTLRKKFN